MKLGQRTVYALLIALVCVNILVRFPRTSHETGVDSFFIHNLATAISEQGRVPWVLNGLGYFGWYPLSYPSAQPLVISGFAQASGLPEEGTILILSLLYGSLGALVAFAMARTFRKDDLFAIAVAFIFSLAPRFTSFTVWSASSRNLFMVLIPVFLWALVRSHRKPTMPNLLVLFLLLVLMLATHRLTILLAVVILAFLVAYVFVLLYRVMRIRFPRSLLAPMFRRWAPRLALAGIALIALGMLLATDVLEEYSAGEICFGENVKDQLCNLGVSITRSAGLALPFSFVGVFQVVRQRNKGFLEVFLVLSLLSLTPTLFLRQYTGFYILPFLAIFAAFGVLAVLHLFVRSPRKAAVSVLGTILIIGGSSLLLLGVEVGRQNAMSDANYTTALYLTSLPAGSFVTNDGLLGIRVSSISARPGIPVGGAGTTSQSAELLAFGFYNATEVFQHERRVPITELTIEDDSPFALDGIDARRDWINAILEVEVDEVANRTIERYRLQVFLENDRLQGAFTAYGNVYEPPSFNAAFQRTIHLSRYKLYDGSSEDIYLAFPPLGTSGGAFSGP